jgi:hypothetical protein
MEKLKRHWTERSVASFVHRISFDFVTQIQKRMDEARISRKELAKCLRVDPSRVSQVLNSPGNLTLLNAVEYAKSVGLKVALVAYDDGDPQNQKGPISSEIFEQCWKLQGTPIDFFELASTTMPTCRVSLFHNTAVTDEPWRSLPIDPQQLIAVAATDMMSVANA